jgi:predicted HTH transcriptional regulator
LENKFQNLKESYKLECKLAKNTFPKEGLKSYSAFANTDGGKLILGIEEIKNELCPVGVENPEKIIKELFDNLNNNKIVNKNIITNNMVKVEIIEGKSIIIIDIPRAKYVDKPIYLNDNLDQSYKRNYEGDYRCTKEEIKIMLRDAAEDTFDSMLLEDYDESDLDMKSVSSYRQKFNDLKPEHPFSELPMEEFLEKINVIKKDRKKQKRCLTLAGLLVFGKTTSIKDTISYFHLEYVDKSEINIERWGDRVIYDGTWGEGNIYNFYFLAINKIYNSMERNFEINNDKITRAELTDVQIALREAFVNSIIHADFKIEEGLKITKYHDYFEFENPGILRISQSDFFNGEHSKPRNHFIQEIFRFLNLCERAGTGIPKILKTVKSKSYRYPEIDEKNNIFIFKFWYINEIESIKGLTKDEKSILLYLSKYKIINSKIAREELGFTKYKAVELFNKLIEQKIIKKIGESRATGYILCYSKEMELIMKNGETKD